MAVESLWIAFTRAGLFNIPNGVLNACEARPGDAKDKDTVQILNLQKSSLRSDISKFNFKLESQVPDPRKPVLERGK